jgi:glycosyltransferase involved in cell wall biosynthesis
MPLVGNNIGDYGQKRGPEYYKYFGCEVLLTLIDSWVLNQQDPEVNWVPWTPIDHDPAPPLVLQSLQENLGLVKPIAMTRFGQKELAKHEIDSYYIPHGINTELYGPRKTWREEVLKANEWEDKFVIGCVGTNTVERKNWTASLKAFKIFNDRHPDSVFYMHTQPVQGKGLDLNAMRFSLDLGGKTYFPSQVQMSIGIEDDVMARAYNSFDVFLLPSKGEGFGIPIMEAQSCGVPVITTNCTGQAELVDGGWLIKDLIPVWTAQNSWQFDCHVEEVVEYLEEAYQAKKDGSMEERRAKARNKALEYDEKKIFDEMWVPVLEDIDKLIKSPRNREGVQQWRTIMIPRTCMPRKVLDIGCGVTEPYKDVLSGLGEYVGVDIKGGNGIVKANAEDLPFGDGSTPLNPNFRLDPDHKVVKLPYVPLSTGDGLISW